MQATGCLHFLMEWRGSARHRDGGTDFTFRKKFRKRGERLGHRIFEVLDGVSKERQQGERRRIGREVGILGRQVDGEVVADIVEVSLGGPNLLAPMVPLRTTTMMKRQRKVTALSLLW
ncbi:hypothetical protein SESBI_43360 [Sesbania bispinosa]|nr:hypothetical protein SESBI_43360 [Sesbania bispinosa]